MNSNVKTIPLESSFQLNDPRVKKTGFIEIDLPFPPFALSDPRSGNINVPNDFPLPPFAIPVEAEFIPVGAEPIPMEEEPIPAEFDVNIHLSRQQRRNQSANRRRKQRKADLRSLPDDHQDKKLHFMRCGRKFRNKWVKANMKAEWFFSRSLQNNEQNSGPYYSNYLKYKEKAEAAKAKSKEFYQLGGCRN